MRIAAASSAMIMTSGAAIGMISGSRAASAGSTAAGGTTAAGCSLAGSIAGGLGDRLRTLAGGRARMMPLCRLAAIASSGWWSKVGKEKIAGVLR